MPSAARYRARAAARPAQPAHALSTATSPGQGYDPTQAALATLAPARAELLAWGAARGWPLLRLTPWASLVMGERFWRRFCAFADNRDVRAARQAAGLGDQ